jgi:hypothetical protein
MIQRGFNFHDHRIFHYKIQPQRDRQKDTLVSDRKPPLPPDPKLPVADRHPQCGLGNGFEQAGSSKRTVGLDGRIHDCFADLIFVYGSPSSILNIFLSSDAKAQGCCVSFLLGSLRLGGFVFQTLLPFPSL